VWHQASPRGETLLGDSSGLIVGIIRAHKGSILGGGTSGCAVSRCITNACWVSFTVLMEAVTTMEPPAISSVMAAGSTSTLVASRDLNSACDRQGRPSRGISDEGGRPGTVHNPCEISSRRHPGGTRGDVGVGKMELLGHAEALDSRTSNGKCGGDSAAGGLAWGHRRR